MAMSRKTAGAHLVATASCSSRKARQCLCSRKSRMWRGCCAKSGCEAMEALATQGGGRGRAGDSEDRASASPGGSGDIAGQDTAGGGGCRLSRATRVTVPRATVSHRSGLIREHRILTSSCAGATWTPGPGGHNADYPSTTLAVLGTHVVNFGVQGRKPHTPSGFLFSASSPRTPALYRTCNPSKLLFLP